MGMDAYQNRRSPRGGREDFPTQPWAVRALMEHVIPHDMRGGTVWEPAANRGYMARPLAGYFGTVIASDLHDYGVGYPVIDFLNGPSPADYGMDVDWIITNPPFNLAEDFIHRALDVAKEGVAIFARSAFLEGKARHESIYSKVPPSVVAQFAERVPLVQGRVDAGAATAMPYMWLVWYKGENEGVTRLQWIPPCRKDLERDGDYDEVGKVFEEVEA